MSDGRGDARAARRLLTFRLDQEQRRRLKARLAREGRTMSEVVTHGLRQYVQHARAAGSAKPAVASAKGTEKLVLPDRIAARLRELRATGHSDLLSATLAALNEGGLAVAAARGRARHQPAGGAGPGPAPGRRGAAGARDELRTPAALSAPADGQRGRLPPAPDDQDRPFAARVGAPGRRRRGPFAHPGGRGHPGPLPQARHRRRGSAAAAAPRRGPRRAPAASPAGSRSSRSR